MKGGYLRGYERIRDMVAGEFVCRVRGFDWSHTEGTKGIHSTSCHILSLRAG